MTARTNPVPVSPLTLLITGARPRTLTIAASPVIAGTALAFHAASHISLSVFAFTLIAALAIQAATNLYNDAADGVSGNDTPARRGPPRLTATGQALAGDVKRAALWCFGLAGAAGLYLVHTGGWPILLAGILSIASGYAYSSGPKPLSHSPLGEILVIAFFGVIAVTGTYYLQTGSVSLDSVAAGLSIGLIGAGVLMVNNHRDRSEDKRAGRRTLAIVSGPARSKWIYAALLAFPFIIQFANEARPGGAGNWLPLLTAPFALYLVLRFRTAATGPELNMLLVQTAKLQFAFALLYATGLLQTMAG